MANNFLLRQAGPILHILALPLLFIGLSGVLFLPDLSALNDIWLNNHSFDTGYPILGISLLLSYLTQSGKPTYNWQPSIPLLLTGLCLSTLLYIATNLLTLQGPRLFSYILIFIFFIAINSHRSQRLNKILVFGILIYAIPVWGIITPFLQMLTVKATSAGLQLANIPAIIHGTYISLPGGTLEVEEGCAGLRYLVTTLLICHIFCVLNSPNIKGWLLMFISGSVLALVANWLRVYILSYVAYITDLQHPWMHDHAALGWAVYAIIYIPLYFLSSNILAKYSIQRDFSFSSKLSTATKSSPLLAMLFSGLIIAVPYMQYTYKAQQPLDDIRFKQPEEIALCYRNIEPAQLIPAYSGYDKRISTTYDCTEGKIFLHQFVYLQQKQGKELINVFNSLLDEETWYEVDDFRLKEPLDFSIRRFNDKKGGSALVAYTYIIGNINSASNKNVQAEMLRHGLFKEIPAAMVAITMTCNKDCKNEKRFLQDFFAKNFTLISKSN